MSNTITVRLPDDLAEWLEDTARKTGLPKGRIIRQELEKARKYANRPFLRLAGAIAGTSDLSMRKGFSTGRGRREVMPLIHPSGL